MFDPDSRYNSLDTYTAPDDQGRPVKIVKVRFIPNTPAQLSHTVTQSDRPDLLAFQYYRRPVWFWRIADANSVLDPADMVIPGLVIKIPPQQ
jgi:nucleoid-associated protein YgaU